MRLKEVFLVVWVVVFVCGSGVFGVDRLVPSQYSTIQAGINAAGAGDTVIVAPGTYYENINFNGKDITVVSTNPDDPNIVASTIIDANGSGSAVTFENGEGPDAVITGFTITGGGDGTKVGCCMYYGSGIYCSYASPTITRNVISGNIGLNDPDGFYYTCGGGIACLSSNAIIARNVIKENEAFFGGGIYIWDVRDIGTNPTITNNIINGNEATYGAGIYVDRADTTITNNLICDNSSIEWSGGIESFGAVHIIITNNILWANLPTQIEDFFGDGTLSVTYNNVEGGWSGEGNIKEDPLFVDAANGDYHLQLDSPCINAGDPCFVPQPDETDLDGNPRVLSGRVDIGPYEFSGNLRPVADAGADQAISDMSGQVTLDGSGSSDPASDPLSYHWSQTFGPEVEIDDANSAITTFSPVEYGGYIFELVVNDGFLDSFTDSVNIVVGSGHIPVADAGLPRYAGTNPVKLDGTGSYDPDNSGPLSYQWQQISGPNLTIIGANTPTPRISGFTRTDSIQRCEFELIVSDGQYDSLPVTVFVIIVHNRYSESLFRLETGTFDPERPTIIHFGRGGSWDDSDWNSRANILSETTDTTYDYFRAGDKLIVYLSMVAPSYSQLIQLTGNSGGAWASIEVAGYMNRTYQDRRYAVNHVTLFDGGTTKSLISRFLISAVDGEQCWVDSYVDEYADSHPSVLNVEMYQFDHCGGHSWYKNSLTHSDLKQFTSPVAGPGVIAGAYWSVIGPGRNLQLASTPDTMTYRFKWEGSTTSGYMDFYDESLYPGRLPEPVTLFVRTDANATGLVLTCEESQNAVGYQLLMGPDPNRVGHYEIISDTVHPPNDAITSLPFEKIYWTVRAYDQYDSTIYADPVYIDAHILSRPVENLTSGKKYGWIRDAIQFASNGDEIVAYPGTYYENINFYGKILKVRSSDPTDPSVVAATVINGGYRGPVVTFTGRRQLSVLSGFTITGASLPQFVPEDNPHNIPPGMGSYNGAVAFFNLRRSGPVISNCVITGNQSPGIYSYKSNPTFINCVIADNDSNGVEVFIGYLARFINCTIAGNRGYGMSGTDLIMRNCTVVDNLLSGIASYAFDVRNSILWGNASGDEDAQQIIDYFGSGLVTYSDVQGGWQGQGNIDSDPCFAVAGYWDVNGTPVDSNDDYWFGGDYHLKSEAGRWDSVSENWVLDEVTSLCIDAGNPGYPLGDEPNDVNNVRLNIGAYGGTVEASMGPVGWALLADMNNDGDVSFADVGIWAGYWLEAGSELPGDLNRDGVVDWLDYALVGLDFGK